MPGRTDVPIVEPEVLMDGDHDIDRCYEVSMRVPQQDLSGVGVQRVALEGMILKPNMAISGKKCCEAILRRRGGGKNHWLLKSCVPAAVPGCLPLRRAVRRGRHRRISTPETGSAACRGASPFPTVARCQAAPQKAWSGKPRNAAAGPAGITHRSADEFARQQSEWQADLEKQKAA